MSVVRGNTQNLRNLNKMLRSVDKELAIRIARRSAIVLTAGTQMAFDGGETIYNTPRKAGESGPLTLVKTGKTRGALAFVANGTIVRAQLGTRYARYLIGKYAILPNGNAALPSQFLLALSRVVKQVGDAYFAERGGA